MSRYHFLSAIVVLLLSGCASKGTLTQRAVPLPLNQNSVNANFHVDDLYLMYALDAKYRQDFTTSAAYFEKLYDINQEVLYMHEAINNQIRIKAYDEIKRLLDKSLPTHPQDSQLQRYLAAYYLDKHQFKKAQHILQNLIEKENVQSDKILLATTQVGIGEVHKALSYHENLYAQEKTPEHLLDLAKILYNHLDQKDRAKRLLQTHVDFVGYDDKVCYMLMEIYQKEQDLNGLTHVAQKLYEKTHKTEFAKIVLDIYKYQKDDASAMAFLEKFPINNPRLLDFYVRAKKFTKAQTLARTLYHDSQDVHYLAQMAMIEYEASDNSKDPMMLKRVQEKFEKVIANVDEPSFNNFYGYILIDHDIDVEKGIKLIEKALAKSPKAPYFIDSLAWGYYKQHQCEKALSTIEPIMIEVKEPEILEHYNTIKNCQ